MHINIIGLSTSITMIKSKLILHIACKLLCTFIPAAGIPRLAMGNIIGTINDHEFGVARLFANISRTGHGTRVTGMVIDVPKEVGKFLVC